MIQAPEPAVQNDWPQQGFPLGSFGPMPAEMEAKANELLDNFAAILEKRGILVDRPTPLDFSSIQRPSASKLPRPR
jgi:glycine amidinotransferase